MTTLQCSCCRTKLSPEETDKSPGLKGGLMHWRASSTGHRFACGPVVKYVKPKHRDRRAG